MFLVTDIVMDELPTVKHVPETKSIRIVFGLNGHLSLSLDEAAHLAAELGTVVRAAAAG